MSRSTNLKDLSTRSQVLRHLRYLQVNANMMGNQCKDFNGIFALMMLNFTYSHAGI